jgi:hypothetical protein
VAGAAAVTAAVAGMAAGTVGNSAPDPTPKLSWRNEELLNGEKNLCAESMESGKVFIGAG